MRFVFILVFSLGFNAIGLCQKKEEAIIQGLYFYVKTAYFLDSASFPAYTTNPIFIENISNEISYLCKQKFGVRKTEFALPDSIEVKYGHTFKFWKRKKLKTPEYSVSIFIRTSIKIGKITDTAFVYTFNTEVIAKDYLDHVCFASSSKIPFITVFGDEITDKVEMSEYDFYNFYMDGIRAAFQEEDKIFELRYIYKPQTSDYKEFLENPKILHVKCLENNYLLYSDTLLPDSEVYSNRSIFEFDEQLWSESLNTKLSKTHIYNNPIAKEGFLVRNKHNNIDYTVKLNVEKNTSKKVYSQKESIQFSINKGSTQVGKFHFPANKKLEGILNNKKYRFEWSEVHNITEIHNETNTVALIKEDNDYKWIYYKEPISDDQLADLFTLIFSYDFAYTIQKQVIWYHYINY